MSLHIVLGPSGAGKSEFIKKRLNDQPNLTHLDRDDMAITLMKEQGIDHHLWVDKNDAQISNDILSKKLNALYFQKLDALLEQKTPDLIIDYIPTMNLKWVKKTITKLSGFKHTINIDGIFAPPEKTLKRTIERNTSNIDLERKTANILAENRRYFKAWINTYKIFPKQLFLAVTKDITDIKIWDNTENFKCIAEWLGQGKEQDRIKTIYDRNAYYAFQKLTMINLNTADFDAKILKTEKNDDKLQHFFDVTTKNFYD